MLSKIRKHFTFANVALTVALLFAMTGGAYAAGKYLITSTKQISPKVLKALAGKPGVKGATGPAGPQGPAGVAGAKGETGPGGKEGPAGKDGSNGESVAAKEVKTTEATCEKHGGSSFTAGGTTTLACNGKEGKEGKEGSPWTAKGALPVGSSETGQWSFVQNKTRERAEAMSASISFTIPLAKALGEANVHFIGPEEGEGEPKVNLPTGCSGNYAAPKAASGNLCVFTERVLDYSTLEPLPLNAGTAVIDAETGEVGAGTSGAYIFSRGAVTTPGETEALIFGSGDWVVTG